MTKRAIDTAIVTTSESRKFENINVFLSSRKVNQMGIEYKLIDSKKYRDFIIENKKRFVFAYSSTVFSEKIHIFREDKNRTFENLLSHPEKYSFLINLRKEIQIHEKNIKELEEYFAVLQKNTEEVEFELEIISLKSWMNEIEILETQKKAIAEGLLAHNIKRSDIINKIKQIDEEIVKIQSNEYF